jgi:hypothetical protein
MGLGEFKNRGQVGVPPGEKIGFNSDQYDISDWQVVSDIYGYVYRVSGVFAGADPGRISRLVVGFMEFFN